MHSRRFDVELDAMIERGMVMRLESGINISARVKTSRAAIEFSFDAHATTSVTRGSTTIVIDAERAVVTACDDPSTIGLSTPLDYHEWTVSAFETAAAVKMNREGHTLFLSGPYVSSGASSAAMSAFVAARRKATIEKSETVRDLRARIDVMQSQIGDLRAFAKIGKVVSDTVRFHQDEDHEDEGLEVDDWVPAPRARVVRVGGRQPTRVASLASVASVASLARSLVAA